MMATTKERLVLFTILSLSALSVFSQKDSDHEISFFGGYGSHSLNPTMNMGKSGANTGFVGGIDYSYFVSNQWSIRTGVEVAQYGSELKGTNLYDDYQGFKWSIESYKEDVSTMFVNIPIMAQIQTRGHTHKFYVALGGKVGIPISAESKLKPQLYVTDGVTKESYASTKDIEGLKTAFMLATEAGFKWKLANNLRLYTGVYLDYGLNDVSNRTDNRLIEKVDNEPVFNSMAISKYHKIATNTDTYFVDKLSPMSFGFKAKLAFSIGGDKSGYQNKKARDIYINPIYPEYNDDDTLDVEKLRKRVEAKERNIMRIDASKIIDDPHSR